MLYIEDCVYTDIDYVSEKTFSFINLYRLQVVGIDLTAVSQNCDVCLVGRRKHL